MVAGVARLTVDRLVVADALKGNNCDEYWNDEDEEEKVLIGNFGTWI